MRIVTAVQRRQCHIGHSLAGYAQTIALSTVLRRLSYRPATSLLSFLPSSSSSPSLSSSSSSLINNMNTDAIDIRNAYRKMAKRPRSEIDEEEASNIVRSGVDGHTASFKVEEEELEGSKTLKANKHVTETIKRSVVPFGQDASSSSPSFIEEDPPTTPRPTPRYTAIHLTDISDTTPSPPSTRPIRPPRAGRTGYKGSRESHRQAARFSQDNGIIPHKKANNARAARAIMSELTDVHDMEELNSDGELYEEGGAKRRKLHLVDTDEEVVVIPKQVNTEDAPRSSQTMVVDDLVQAAAAPVLPNPPPGHDAVVQDVRPIYDADMPSMAREHPARVWNQEIHAMSPELQPMIKWAYERLVIDEEDEGASIPAN